MFSRQYRSIWAMRVFLMRLSSPSTMIWMDQHGRSAIDNAALEGSPPPAATHVRYGVLGFACGLSMIVYLDRACMATAAPAIVRDLGLDSEADLKWVFSAFALAYALFEVPNGWWCDVFGPRSVLIRIVLWWSLLTAITGIVGISVGGYVLGGVGLLAVIRFVFGAGEAGAYPNITRALHNWFPCQERGFAQGTVWMAGRLIGGLTPLVWMLLVEGIGRPASAEAGALAAAPLLPPLLHWRAVFWLFGLIGVAWVVGFAAWFRNRPEEKPGVNAAELVWIHSGGAESVTAHARTPWMRFLTSRNLQALCLMYACQTYGWYFYITYLPGFLEQHYGVPPSSASGIALQGRTLVAGRGGLPPGRSAYRPCGAADGKPPLGAAAVRRGRPLAYRVVFPGLSRGPERFLVLCSDLARRILHRPGNGGRLGGVPGHRPAPRGSSGRLHEHDRQPGRRAGRLDVRLCARTITGGPCRSPRSGRAGALGGGENRRANAGIPDHLPDLRRRLRGWRFLLAPHRSDRGRCPRGG